MLVTILWVVSIGAAMYIYFRQKYSVFANHGIKGPRPFAPFGTMTQVMLKREHIADYIIRVYNAHPGEKFIGTYEFTKPVVSIRDLELLKKITVKDFDHFVDHRVIIDEESDPFIGKNLFSMTGQKWRDMRSTLSPAFTSSKIRAMVPFMVEVGDQMTEALEKKIKESGSEYLDVEIKDLATRYANDVIATCAFGLKVDSHAQENNEFFKMGKAAVAFGFLGVLKFFGFLLCPTVMKKLNLSLFSRDMKNFFKDLVLSTMKEREDKHIKRPDMIHLLMEAKKGKLTYDTDEAKKFDAGFATVEESSVGKKQITRVWDDTDLIAQAVLFFVAGFETVSTAMAFLLVELAINPDIQEKLYKEIKETDDRTKGKFDYNSIQSMPYLDMVVSEVLRLWTPAIGTDRMCVKDYNLGKANNSTEDYILRKGHAVAIPIWAIHRDPDYFRNPNKFDPDRFSSENVHKIKPFTYMPFGLGPRNCIGSRFALCEIKVMVYQLLLKMEVSPGKKLLLPLQLALGEFNIRPKGGHWLQVRAREQEN